VFDALGHTVAVVVDGNQNAGEHIAVFDGKGLASGLYYYRLKVGNSVLTKKLLLLR
jgi:hypothetical protein